MSEHAEIITMIDKVFADMRKRNEISIQPNAIGDKVAGLIDPRCRAPQLGKFCTRTLCRMYARDRLRSFGRDMQAGIQQGEFELEPYCPTGNGNEYVRREDMTLDERLAFSASLGAELVTKGKHKDAFDAETNKLIKAKAFDERGRPRGSSRAFDDAA